MIVRARAPLRLGLAGGGTDVSPYCDQYGGYVLNASIDRYAYAIVRELNESILSFIATDQGRDEQLPLDADLEGEGELILHRTVYRVIMDRYNDGKRIPVELSTFCDAPMGSGLGSSSTLVVAMIRAFVELLNLPLDDYMIADLAFQVERVECGFAGGRQDQYSATFGGFNFIEFYADNRAIVNPLRIKNYIICELEASLVLFYSGVSRESARIIAEQSSNVHSGTQSAIEALHGLKQEALTMKECLLCGDFDGVVDSMRIGWENKRRLAKTVSNSHIEKIYKSALNAGALGGKISGAGGGGFITFYVPPYQRMNVIRVLDQFEGQVSNCHFTKNGTQAWRLR